MESYAYYNGEFDRLENIKIPLTDRSIYFGDAVYDAAIGRYEFVMWGEEHVERFLSNAKRIGIEHSFAKNFILELLKEIAVKSCIPQYFLYFQLSRNAKNRKHSALGCAPNLLVTIEPIELNAMPLKLITYPDLRYGYCDIKTVNLLPSVLASTRAESLGCDEAIFHRDGIVTECAKSNISILKGGVLKTHPLCNKILPGITRKHLLQACNNLGIPYMESEFSVQELFTADEILVTSTTKLSRRANNINGKAAGMKDNVTADKICQFLYNEFENLGNR